MYLLDTNTCSYIINRKPHSVVERIKTLPPHHVKLSAVSLAELQYGVAKSSATDKNRAALLQFASAFEIVPFDDTDAEVFGLVRAILERAGRLIGPYDMQIAAQALARDLVLVTNNTGEFARLPGLRLEDWTE